jgi:hypothetical protein
MMIMDNRTHSNRFAGPVSTAETYWQPAAPFPRKTNLPDFPEPDEAKALLLSLTSRSEKMRSLIFGIAAAACLLGGGVSLAQPTTQGTAPSGTATAPAPSRAPTAAGTSAGVNNSAADRDKNVGAAAGNNNQAVATTNANAPAPAKGANSFTMGEAKSRLEKNGFSNVGDLTKDDNGVWRGNAQKGGSTTAVWLDYKGNTGEGK